MRITLKNQKKTDRKEKTTNKIIFNNDKNYKKLFLKEKIKLKEELEKKIKENEVMIRKELIAKKYEIIKKLDDSLELSSDNNSFFKKIKLELPTLKTLDIFLFLAKMIICVIILPLIKNKFNIRNALGDMLRNLYESIFTLTFFKDNFNKIILFLDKLGNLIEPYKYLKRLLEKKEEKNNKKTKDALKRFINYFINFENLTKIKLIMGLYKKNDNIFDGTISENIDDVIALTSCILTILEVILYSYENHLLYKYIPKLNIFSLYSIYLIETIITIKKIHNLKTNTEEENPVDIDIVSIIEEYGHITGVLLIFCSNNEFYNDDF